MAYEGARLRHLLSVRARQRIKFPSPKSEFSQKTYEAEVGAGDAPSRYAGSTANLQLPRGQPYYPDKSWEDRIRAVIFGTERFAICPLCTQCPPRDVFEDGDYRRRCLKEVPAKGQAGLSHICQTIWKYLTISLPLSPFGNWA